VLTDERVSNPLTHLLKGESYIVLKIFAIRVCSVSYIEVDFMCLFVCIVL